MAEAFTAGAAANTDALAKQLADKIAQYEADDVNPDTVPAVQKLREAIAAASTGASEHENQVFSHLLTFFSRYYDKGDFISQRRYKGDTYLSLLFSEIYLDWYFNRPQQLLDGLNEQMAAYRLEAGAENFRDYTADDLNKLAFWNATGSGKTLLLHVNIHQYLHYFQAGKSNVWPDRIILLTPNEGLSRQHLEEFRLSGLNAHLFDKNQSGSLYKGWIDVIEVTKLAEEMADKTVATGAFEGNNLVLVDEGHRGAGTAGGVWMARRAALVRGGFARAGNFYPDFLLWLVDDATGQQWLSFVDPKGIRNLDLNDPKLGLYAEIKEREKELEDRDLILNAFILSFTRYGDLLNVGSAGSKEELENRHVLFMDDGKDTYLRKLFERIAA